MKKLARLEWVLSIAVIIALFLTYRSESNCFKNEQGYTIGKLADNDFDYIKHEEYIYFQYVVNGKHFKGASLIRIPDKEVEKFENGKTFVVVYCNDRPYVATIILEYPFEGNLGQNLDNEIDKKKIKINIWNI